MDCVELIDEGEHQLSGVRAEVGGLGARSLSADVPRRCAARGKNVLVDVERVVAGRLDGGRRVEDDEALEVVVAREDASERTCAIFTSCECGVSKGGSGVDSGSGRLTLGPPVGLTQADAAHDL